jgi:hypothetical protein
MVINWPPFHHNGTCTCSLLITFEGDFSTFVEMAVVRCYNKSNNSL